MIVEEAGQVLEAHVLAALVPSIAQVIMIGDPLQLRPNLVNYSTFGRFHQINRRKISLSALVYYLVHSYSSIELSVDNPRTGKIYRFDQSLMERLSTSGLHMSCLDVQRRMRPAISSLIRYA
jgi:superfamily I DNA and/or RNA helicase